MGGLSASIGRSIPAAAYLCGHIPFFMDDRGKFIALLKQGKQKISIQFIRHYVSVANTI
jgi:hypothetical protein